MQNAFRSTLLIALALFCCGFVVTTPESRKARQKELAAWNRAVSRQFDRKALHAFLAATLAQNPSVAGVALSPATLGARFETKTDRFCWVDGKWLLVVPDPETTAFELRSLTSQGWIIFRCERAGKSKFSLVSAATHDPLIPLCPPPYAFAPDG
jgi:hypothetical protein